MKDFIKWLGVNEKVAKVIVWIFIIIVFIITINLLLESVGLPYYRITYDNITKIDGTKITNLIISVVISLLNFYSFTFLVFRLKEFKNIFKYSLLYVVLNIVINKTLGYIPLQIYIILFFIIFCYLYSKKKKRYIFYGIIAYVVGIGVQMIWYTAKARFIDYSTMSDITKSILSMDYFIIMILIIVIKEIYLKKRGEKLCGVEQDAYSGLATSKKKENSLKKSQKN